MLDSFLTEHVRKHFGNDTQISEIIPVSKRAAVTCRVKLNGRSAPAYIFVKHIPADTFPSPELPEAHVEFAEELLVQRFLAFCNPKQKFHPDLLAFDPQGLMIIEDLGTEQHAEIRSFEYLTDRLAHSLALLHDASRGKEAAYLALRARSGLREDRRRYGAPAQLKRFDSGARTFLKSCRERGIECTLLETIFSICLTDLSKKDDLRSLIHDDLGNARQTFEVEDRLYLLDFEYSRFDCCLIDLCKPVLGKFELNYINGQYLWNNPAFPLTFTEHYRRYRREISGLSFTDKIWNQRLGAAFIFHAFTLLGRLDYLEPDRRLVGTVQQNRNGILYHLSNILPPGYEELSETINKYLGTSVPMAASLPGSA